jgi:hypothetical protein
MFQVRRVLAGMILLAGIVIPSAAQQKNDVVYQKDGEIIQGTIISDNPGSSLRIRVNGNSVWVIYYSNIDKIDRAVAAGQAVAPDTLRQRAAAVVETPAVVPRRGNGTSVGNNSAGNATPRPAAPAPAARAAQPYVSRSSGPSPSGVSIGFDIGPGFYREFGSYDGNSGTNNPQTGLLVGGFIDVQTNPYFSLQSGIEYSMRGGSTSGYTSSGSYVSEIDKFQYLSLIIDAKFKTPIAPSMSVYGLAGLNLGFLLSGSSAYDTSGINFTQDDKSIMTSIDFGFDLGAGMEFPTGGVTPFLEAVYYLGVTNIVSQTDLSGYFLSNRGLELRAGLKFPL